MAVSVPLGLSGVAAISLVQDYTDEYSLPTTAKILGFLNRGVEEVTTRIGGIRLWQGYPTVANQPTVNLNDDVLEVISANFSSASSGQFATPFSPGALVYPMEQLDQKMFMDAAAGFPVVGFGPPQAYFIYQDSGQAPTNTLPAPGAPVLTLIKGTSPGTIIEVVQTYVNANGETTASPVADITPNTAQQGVVGFPPGYTNATGYNTYAGAVGGPYYKQNGSTATPLGTRFTLPSTLLTGTATPPGSNTATGSGQGGALSMQLYPASMIGQVNVYYKARPLLWGDTSDKSYTNLDTSCQEAVVLFAVMRMLANRGRSDEIKLWQAEYESRISSLSESMGRRQNPKSGRVRDVTNRSFPNLGFGLLGTG